MTTRKDADITVAVNTVYPITFKAAATTGTAKAHIGEDDVEVDWAQLWKDGPKFGSIILSPVNSSFRAEKCRLL